MIIVAARLRTFAIPLLAAGVLLVMGIGISLASFLPGETFTDDDGNVHEGNIEAIAAVGITKGCNPPANDHYCPTSELTRGEMASFLRRALALPLSTKDYFTDDDDSVFEDDINSIAEAGITKGCNPPDNTRYCPEGKVRRDVMAAFLHRAFQYPSADVDYFSDDDGSLFEDDINAIGAAGVTSGCNPPSNDWYCPEDVVLRDQMASFLARSLGLPDTPPPPTTSTTTQPPSGSTNWSCSRNASSDGWDCSGNIDKTDPLPETWSCSWEPIPDTWDCSGNIDKSDASPETWSCSWKPISDTWVCQGNIDKIDALSEYWGQTYYRWPDLTVWRGEGDIDKTNDSSESWTNDWDWDLQEWNGRSNASEQWTCTRNPESGSWDCSGDVGKKAPMVMQPLERPS